MFSRDERDELRNDGVARNRRVEQEQPHHFIMAPIPMLFQPAQQNHDPIVRSTNAMNRDLEFINRNNHHS